MRRPELRTLIRWSGPAALLAAFLLLRWFGDQWWPAMPLLYGPRWPLAVLLLSPLLAHRRGAGRRTGMATAAALLAVMLVLDFRIPWRALLPPWGSPDQVVRVVSWNAQSRGLNGGATIAALLELDADLIMVAECGPVIGEALAETGNFEVFRTSNICLASSLPVLGWEARNPSDFWRAGGSGAIGRLLVEVDGVEVVVGGVHLETPRDALNELRFLAVLSFRSEAIKNQDLRDVESSTARNFIRPADEIRPTIVAGDFNLVAESRIFRRWWGDLTNAFGHRGAGLGWTKRTRLFGVRIDHVLSSRDFRVRAARIGEALGSDHHMLVADLELRN